MSGLQLFIILLRSFHILDKNTFYRQKQNKKNNRVIVENLRYLIHFIQTPELNSSPGSQTLET